MALKNDFLIKGTQALDLLHSAAAYTRLESYAEIISDSYLIKSLIKRNGLDIDVGIDDFNVFTSYGSCLIDNFL